MKKYKIISFFIVLIFIILFSFYYTNSNKIENNIVSIKKPFEISNSRIIETNNNLKENIFSWFFINKNTIITVEHWVNWFDSEYIIEDIFWNKYNWTLIYKDKDFDYAIIKTNSSNNNFYNYKTNNKIIEWEEITSISYVENKLVIKKWVIKDIIDNKLVLTDIKLEKWDSWWVLIDSKNNIIAINNWYNFEKKLSISTKIKDIIDNQ